MMSKVLKASVIPVVVLCLVLTLFSACTTVETTTTTTTTQPPAVTTTVTTTTTTTTIKQVAATPEIETAKYVFLFIADGYSIATRNAAEAYMSSVIGEEFGQYKLTQSTLPAQGIVTTYSLDSIITDSAAAATAFATGKKTINGALSMDGSGSVSYETIAEKAHAAGMKVGIVTSVSLDHATPAAFYAHQSGRSDYYGIAVNAAESDFDYFAGGPFTDLDGAENDQPDVLELAAAAGYTIIDDPAAFAALSPGAGKIMAFNSVLNYGELGVNSMPYELDRAADDISLAQYTEKAIDLLDNPNGFFIMVEGGKIDWASHANDAGSAVHDVFAFDAAVDEAMAFYQQHPDDTLIVVCADHECGGITNGFAATGYSSFYDILQNQTMSYWEFGLDIQALVNENPDCEMADVLPLIETAFGLSPDAEGKLALGENDLALLEDALVYQKMGFDRFGDPACISAYYYYDPIGVVCTHMLNNRAGIGWTSYAHTGGPTPIAAIGAQCELFEGFFDNTEVFEKIISISGL